MVAEPNIRVGCAAATYAVSGECYKSFLMACNFAFTYVIGKPVYSDCSVATSNCTTGRNPKYPNLCSTLEEYDVS